MPRLLARHSSTHHVGGPRNQLLLEFIHGSGNHSWGLGRVAGKKENEQIPMTPSDLHSITETSCEQRSGIDGNAGSRPILLCKLRGVRALQACHYPVFTLVLILFKKSS